MRFGRWWLSWWCAAACLASASVARAQTAQPPAAPSPAEEAGQHDHTQMNMAGGGWQFMQDGVLFAEVNHQGGPRGGTEFVIPNWWMGMASRTIARGQLTLSGMLSLDPASVGQDGYRELFQAGEDLDMACEGCHLEYWYPGDRKAVEDDARQRARIDPSAKAPKRK